MTQTGGGEFIYFQQKKMSEQVKEQRARARADTGLKQVHQNSFGEQLKTNLKKALLPIIGINIAKIKVK